MVEVRAKQAHFQLPEVAPAIAGQRAEDVGSANEGMIS